VDRQLLIAQLPGECSHKMGGSVTVRSLCLSAVLVLEFSDRGNSQIGSQPDISIRKLS